MYYYTVRPARIENLPYSYNVPTRADKFNSERYYGIRIFFDLLALIKAHSTLLGLALRTLFWM